MQRPWSVDNSDSYFSSSLAGSCYTLSDKKGNRAKMFVDRCAVFCSSLAQITESLELGYLSFIKHFSGFTRMTFNPCPLLKATISFISNRGFKPGSRVPPTYLGRGRRHSLEQRCALCEHLSLTHNLSQALIAGLPAKLNSTQIRRQVSGQCLVHIMCRR